jgi:hypothetical protein
VAIGEVLMTMETLSILLCWAILDGDSRLIVGIGFVIMADADA